MSLLKKFYFTNILQYNLKLSAPWQNVYFTQVKNLYSPAALGIDKFLVARKKINERFLNYSDKFRSKMLAFVEDESNMIFTEDLKNMVHLADAKDLDLVLNMIKKFNSNSDIRFGSFVFGPVVMRMFHFLDAPQEALQCFHDPANCTFFDQQTSYQILLDLLYNHEMYDDMYKVFDIIKEKKLNMTKYPKYSVTIIFAACYKQNTPESFKYASQLWTEMSESGTMPLRRATSFFAGLAIKQGAPHISLEAISSQKHNYVTIRNIKAVALAEMGRADDALMVLRQVLETDSPVQDVKHTFFEETIAKVKSAVEKCNKDDVTKEFDSIVNALQERSLIDNQDLENHLNSEINVQQNDRNRQNMFTEKRMPFNLRRKNSY